MEEEEEYVPGTGTRARYSRRPHLFLLGPRTSCLAFRVDFCDHVCPHVRYDLDSYDRPGPTIQITLFLIFNPMFFLSPTNTQFHESLRESAFILLLISVGRYGIMDLLKSLNLEDHLPEQQTRAAHLASENPDFDLSLGFDACCSCGRPQPTIDCDNCHRVKYCSMDCLKKDAAPIEDDEDEALGHSAVICALLAICNEDEAVEEGKEQSLDTSKRNAAIDRVVSEFESYPATLANVIMDGPCYQDALTKATKGSLTIHILGASIDSELWEGHPDPSQESRVFQSYAEALAEIADRFRMETIQLYFIGPDCPQKDIVTEVKIPAVQGSKNDCVLKATTIRNEYNKSVLLNRKVPDPDIAVFFNPGFTCPDYSWDEALQSLPQGTPCLATTNTELEGVADVEYLFESGFISDLPAGLAMMLQGEVPETVSMDTFFSVNPYCGSRVRQSGTMANDIYMKSRWMYGGVLGKPKQDSASSASAKKQRIEGSGNSKRSNPALV